MDARREWTGPVPKPGAVRLLQVAGLLSIGIAAILFILADAMGGKDAAKFPLILGFNYAVAAPFALLAGWKRPPGLVAGIVALAILLVALPIGPFIVAIVGFLGTKNRDHIRDYYGQGVRGTHA